MLFYDLLGVKVSHGAKELDDRRDEEILRGVSLCPYQEVLQSTHDPLFIQELQGMLGSHQVGKHLNGVELDEDIIGVKVRDQVLEEASGGNMFETR